MNNEESSKSPEEKSPNRNQYPRLRLDAFRGYSIGLPPRILAIMEQMQDDVALRPSSCQSEHTLAAALNAGFQNNKDAVEQLPQPDGSSEL